MTRTHILMLFLLVTIFPVLGSTSRADEPKSNAEDGVIESYNSSSDLPDEIAFDLFLAVVEGASEGSERFDQWVVAKALGIELDGAESFAKAQSRSALFHNTNINKKKEQLISKINVLCSQEQSSKSIDKIYDAMNATDEIQQVVLKKHYLMTINSLSAEEQKAFTAYLNDLKLSSSYAKIDNRKLHDSGELELRAMAEQQCYEYQRDYQVLGGVL